MAFIKPEERNPHAHAIAIEMAQAAQRGESGWNIRCNICGTYGAEWIPGARLKVSRLTMNAVVVSAGVVPGLF